MKLRTVIYTLLLATLCMGCGGSLSMRQLEQLEARVNDAPDSVLTVLTATDMPRWGEARALYALLTVQAQDKSGLDVADDSLISVATHYFTTSRDARHKMLAYYYRARVQYNMGAYAQSIVSASRAEEAAIAVDDDYYLGLIYRCISDCYNMTYNATEELRYIRMAHDCFERVESIAHERYARLRMGRAYMNCGKLEEAIQICEALLTDSAVIQDTNLLSNVLSLYGKIAASAYDFSVAKEALQRLCEIPQYDWAVSDYCNLARIYNNEQLEDSAQFYLDKAKCLVRKEADSVYIYRALYEMALANEDAETALDNYRKIIALNDSVTKATLHQSVAIAHRDHYETRLKVEELRNQQQRYLMRGAAVMILMVVVALGIYIRSCFRRKQEELNEYMELAEDLRHTLYNKEESIGRISEELQLSHAQLDDLRERVDAHEGSVAHMQTQITELFGTYSRLLNNLSETYYENQGSKSAIFKQLDKEIKRISEGNMITELEAILNTNLDNIMARLRAELPHLKEKDYTFLTYLYARFSGKTIATFMRLERNHIYQIKYRLRDEIKASNAPSKDFFLDSMP
ncbi:MAG: hypothetical protein IKJ92_09560 [Bacteroidaceae bacterium]|nr:hypothetical protein [Bacteroidaceae bacterium]